MPIYRVRYEVHFRPLQAMVSADSVATAEQLFRRCVATEQAAPPPILAIDRFAAELISFQSPTLLHLKSEGWVLEPVDEGPLMKGIES